MHRRLAQRFDDNFHEQVSTSDNVRNLTTPALIIHDEDDASVPVAETKEELLTLLRSTHEEGEAALRAAGEVMMLQRIRRFDGQYSTRLAWLWHLIDHESYHRGQIALYARQIGLVPALTRLIQGD